MNLISCFLYSSNTSVVGSLDLRNLCFPRFSCHCPSVWNPLSFDICACLSSLTLFRAGLQFPLAAHTSASDSASGHDFIYYCSFKMCVTVLHFLCHLFGLLAFIDLFFVCFRFTGELQMDISVKI